MKRFLFAVIFFSGSLHSQNGLSIRELAAFPSIRWENIYTDQSEISSPADVRMLYYEYDGQYKYELRPDFSRPRLFTRLEYLQVKNYFLHSVPREILAVTT